MRLLTGLHVLLTLAAMAKPQEEVVVEQSLSSSDPPSQSTTAERAEALLNEIVRYGLHRSQELSDVEERELYERGVKLTKANPAHFVGIFNKQKDRGRELAKYAYAALEASSLLAKQ